MSAFLARIVRRFAVILSLIAAGSPSVVNAEPASDAASAAVAVQNRVAGFSDDSQRPDERIALAAFYAARDFRPVWFDDTGPTRAARLVIGELEQAANSGLRPEDFALSPVTRDTNRGARAPAEIADADFELSSMILKYARHARGGRIETPERALSDFLDRRPALPVPHDALHKVAFAADAGEALRGFHPRHPQFQKLRDLLATLNRDAAREEAHPVALTGPMLVPGQSSDEIPTVRGRLGVAADSGEEHTYDNALLKAVKDFQRSKGLRADGFIGKRTRKALQSESADRRKAIIATMEQWRWMPEDLGTSHVLVNIPAFTATFIKDGVSRLSERVITGKPDTPTPVFSKPMTNIVLRPSWNLPDSIKREKLIAAARRGSTIESEGLVVKKGKRTVQSWSVDWSTADLTAYSFTQPSGDGNALGAVKFLFPNKHSVYMHDTPRKSLFETEERLYSHGCVRLRNPLRFAQAVLDADRGEGALDAEDLADDGPANNEIVLERPVPVHIGYFSVWVNDDGDADYHGDPYGHDTRITLALAGKWDEIDRGPSHDTMPEGEWLAAKAQLKAVSKQRKAAAEDDDSAATAPVRRAQPVRRTTVRFTAKSFFAAPKASSASANRPARRGNTVGDMMNSAYIR